MRRPPLRIYTLAAIVALLLTACAGNPSQTSDLHSVAPQPVVLSSTAPAKLDVSVILTLGGYDLQSRDSTTIDFGFTSGGRPVNFVGDEQVACDGASLTRYVGAYEVVVPTASISGKTVTCVYRSGATSATVTLVIPTAPDIVSPRDGARIPRGTATVLTYQTPPGMLQAVVATGPKSKALPSAGAVSATQATIDTNLLAAGAGALTLTEDLDLQTPQSTPFRSFKLQGSAMTMIQVTWL